MSTKSGFYILAFLLISLYFGAYYKYNNSTLVSADYREECANEGCSDHEVEELYESYEEECLREGCSGEEVAELAIGSYRGPGYSDWVRRLQDAFEDRGYRIDSNDFRDAEAAICEQQFAKCYGFLLFCNEGCKFNDGSSSSPYLCGVCFGFSF